jgi:excinuclease ABC subunit B
MKGNKRKKIAGVSDTNARYNSMSPAEAVKEINKLEKKMLQHAKDLEFEAAAQVRDQIAQLREIAFI